MVELEKNVDDIIKKAISEFDKFKLISISLDNALIIDSISKELISDSRIVYQFWVDENLVYIGKSKGKYFKTRLNTHLQGTGNKTGTQSKFENIQVELKNKNKVYLKFIETEPCSLRNLIEEELIDHYKDNFDLWNFKKIYQ
jgi:hypothetical protein